MKLICNKIHNWHWYSNRYMSATLLNTLLNINMSVKNIIYVKWAFRQPYFDACKIMSSSVYSDLADLFYWDSCYTHIWFCIIYHVVLCNQIKNTYKIYELFYASFISYYIDYNLSYDVLRFRHLLNNVEQYWHKYAFIGSILHVFKANW